MRFTSQARTSVEARAEIVELLNSKVSVHTEALAKEKVSPRDKHGHTLALASLNQTLEMLNMCEYPNVPQDAAAPKTETKGAKAA